MSEIVAVSGASHYLVALKHGVYMVTGKPIRASSDGELVLIAISSPIGGIFFAFIYGNTTMLLTRMNILMSKHHKHVSLIRSTMMSLGIPADLRQRITRYHHFLAVHHNVNAYTMLMKGLSVNLFIEAKANLFRKMFSQGDFFRGAPGGFLRRLLQEMVEATFCPGDVVIRCGDIGDQMYFVVKGRLDVLSAMGVSIGKICENQYFGEIALMISTPRQVSIRAATYCLLALINRATFLPILEVYPEQKLRIEEAMKKYKIADDPLELGEECFTDSSAEEDSSHSEATASKESCNKSIKFASSGSASMEKDGGSDLEREFLSVAAVDASSCLRPPPCAPVEHEHVDHASRHQGPSPSLPSAVEPHIAPSPRLSVRGSATSARHSSSSSGVKCEHSKRKSILSASFAKMLRNPRDRAAHSDHVLCTRSANVPEPPVKIRNSCRGQESIPLAQGSRRGSSVPVTSSSTLGTGVAGFGVKPRRSLTAQQHSGVAFVGAPAQGTLLLGSSRPMAKTGAVLADTNKLSMVGDLMIDLHQEFQSELSKNLEGMESRSIERPLPATAQCAPPPCARRPAPASTLLDATRQRRALLLAARRRLPSPAAALRRQPPPPPLLPLIAMNWCMS